MIEMIDGGGGMSLLDPYDPTLLTVALLSFHDYCGLEP